MKKIVTPKLPVRPSRHEWALQMAELTATRGTCLRRQVGAVFLNKRGHVIATGYNGVAVGQPHCNAGEIQGTDYGPEDEHGVSAPRKLIVVYPNSCEAARAASGTQLDGCGAIHAEQNALLQCGNVYKIHAAYVTASPCVTCTKLLLNTSCQEIWFREAYPQPAAEKLWLSSGRSWRQLPVTK